jgi:hypothetical protein
LFLIVLVTAFNFLVRKKKSNQINKDNVT